MRVTLVLLVAACWTSSRDSPTTPVANAAAPAPTCEQATRAIASVIGADEPNDYVRGLCVRDRWSDAARSCFARLISLDALAACADRIGDDERVQLFRALEDPADERVTVAIAVARLRHAHTGIVECDALVAAVARAFRCDAIPLNDRMLLEDMTTDFRDATNPRLRARFAELCAKSMGEVRQQIAVAGCRP